MWIKHTAALLALVSSLGGYRYYRYQFELNNHQHEDETWHENISCVHEVVLSLLASTGQKAWLEPAIAAFNNANAAKVRVSVTYAEDRDALQDLLAGKIKPTLWSPGAMLWASRLNRTYTGKTAAGGDLVRWDKPEAARVYLQTSLILLVPDAATKNAAGANGRDLVRFSHANPAATGSGFFTLGVLLDEYRATLDAGDKRPRKQVAESTGFLQFLRERERRLFYDAASESGTTALTRSFGENPARYGAVWTWENTASEDKRGAAFVVRPETPVIAQQSVVLLDTASVSSDQREAAETLLNYLATPEAMAFGTKAGFEPARPADVTETADYDALNAATYQWRRLRIAPAL